MAFERSGYTDSKKELGMVLHGVEVRIGKFCMLNCNEHSFHKRLGFVAFSPARGHLKYFKSNPSCGQPAPLLIFAADPIHTSTSCTKVCKLWHVEILNSNSVKDFTGEAAPWRGG